MKPVLRGSEMLIADDCGDDNLVINCSFEINTVKPATYAFVGADQVLGWKSLEGEPLKLWGTWWSQQNL